MIRDSERKFSTPLSESRGIRDMRRELARNLPQFFPAIPASPVAFARIGSYTRDGTAWRWVYAGVFVTKTGAGYGGWASTGETITELYNIAEDMNDSSGLLGNGVTTSNLTGTGLEPKPIPEGRIVRVWTVTGPEGTEYWTDHDNAIDGSCEEA